MRPAIEKRCQKSTRCGVRQGLEATEKMINLCKGLMSAAALCVAMSGAALAQVSDNRVSASTDWSVFVDGNPQQCWSVSAPKETVNTKNGKPATVRRGDILLFVTYGPDGKGIVSFSGGYPFAPDSTVDLDVSGTKFELYVDGEWAWAGTEGDDAKIVAAMKAGSSAVLVARSAKGTQTQDTFSLSGFSAAVDEAAKRCGG